MCPSKESSGDEVAGPEIQGPQVTNTITIEPEEQQEKCMEESDGGPDVFRHLRPPSPGMGQNREAAEAVPVPAP